jgi:hypothetical protein
MLVERSARGQRAIFDGLFQGNAHAWCARAVGAIR